MLKLNDKTLINSIYPNLWATTAGLLQGLTVMQQCVYQMKFRNVCEVKKRLVQPGLVWSRTLSILLSINRESVSLPVFAYSGPILQAILLQAVEKWTNGQLDKMSARMSEM